MKKNSIYKEFPSCNEHSSGHLDYIHERRENGGRVARMDYSCLDVELDLTIQFEVLDNGKNL